MHMTGVSEARMVRLGEKDRTKIRLWVDDEPVDALQGDTLLVAILTSASRLRYSEFGDGARAGFCLMGACQDCWVWTHGGNRLRTCSTVAEAGMRIVTKQPDGLWLSHA